MMLEEKTIIILGSGGVVPSIIYALKKMNAPRKIIVSNRTKEKAEELKNIFNDLSILDWGETS